MVMVQNLTHLLRIITAVFLITYAGNSLNAVEMPANKAHQKMPQTIDKIASVSRLESSILVKVNARKLKTIHKNQANMKFLDATTQELSKILKE